LCARTAVARRLLGSGNAAYAIDIVGILLDIEKLLHLAHVDFYFMRMAFVHVELKISFMRVDALVKPLWPLVEEYDFWLSDLC
jgi:hypothetical protein